MMTITTLLIAGLAVQAILLGALSWKIPDWTRPELLFAVTVPAGTESTKAAAVARRSVHACAVRPTEYSSTSTSIVSCPLTEPSGAIDEPVRVRRSTAPVTAKAVSHVSRPVPADEVQSKLPSLPMSSWALAD